MQCPLCIDSALEPHIHSGIEIDVCPTCKGVWLDRGELAKLATAPDPAPPRRNDRGRDRWDDDDDDDDDDRRKKSKGKKKRKKSLGERLGDVLEDVLDFD